MKRLTTLTLLSLFLNTPNVFANDPNPTPTLLDEMVITATRFPAKRAAIPAHITTISAEEIRNTPATTIPDLLRSQAGIVVTDLTGNGRSFTVDLRGFGESAGTNTLVLVDGRRINQADLGGTDWLQIPLDRVEKIEIIRGGSGGVLYGDNASGGVVNIITKHGEGPLKAEIKVAGGSWGKTKTHLGVQGRHKNLEYAVSGGYRTEDGYRDNSDTNATESGLKLNYEWNDTIGLHLNAGYQTDKAGLPAALTETNFASGLSRKATTSPNNFSDVTDYFFQGGPELNFGQDQHFTLDLSWRKRESKSYFNFTGGEFTGQTNTDVWGLSPRLQLNHTIAQITDQLTIGLDHQSDSETIQNDSLFFGARTLGEFSLRKITTGSYLHNEIRLPSHWKLTQGYRTDRAKFHFQPSTPDQVTMNSEALSAGILFDFQKNSRIYFNYSKSFRYPLLDEQYSFFTNTVNTALRPQRSQESQLGLHHEFTPSITGDVSLFRIDTNDEIYYDVLTFNNTNLNGSVRRDGLELSVTKQFETWSITGNTSWTHATIRNGLYANNAFPGVPASKHGMTLKYFPTDALTMELTGQYIGSRPFISDFSNRFGDQAGYLTVDSTLRYQWPQLTGFINVTNLTNKEYAEYGVLGGFPTERAYYPSPKRGFMVGASTHF